MEDHFYIRPRDTVLVLCINICLMSLSLDVPGPFSTIGREGYDNIVSFLIFHLILSPLDSFFRLVTVLMDSLVLQCGSLLVKMSSLSQQFS